MEKADRHCNIFTRTALSCGSFTSAYSTAIVPFFAMYCAAHAHIAVTACLIIACVIPFAVMPLVYAAVHRFAPLIFGRYHLMMPLSAFAAAFSFVLAFSSQSGTPFENCLLFFGVALFASAVACYRYCAFSVRVRMERSDFGVPAEGRALCVLGALCALGCIVGFYAYDPDTVFINTAYVLAALCSIWAIVQYLTTYYAVPKFSGARKTTVARAFRAVFGGLDVKTFIASVCAVGACLSVIALVGYFCIVRGLPDYAAAITAAAAVCGYAAFAAISTKVARRSVLAVIALAADTVAAVLLIILSAVDMPKPAATATAAVVGVFAGGGLSAAVAVKRRLFVAVKPKNTVGTAFILSGLANYGGCGIAVAIGAAAVGLVMYANVPTRYVFIGCFALSVVIAAIGFALTVIGMKREVYPETLPSDNTEQDEPVRA